MPSLQELREFKTSFNAIGGESAVLAAQHIPFDDLELPGSDPAVRPGSAAGGSPAGEGAVEDFPGISDFGPDGSAGGSGTPADDSDFLALLDAIPDDLVQLDDDPLNAAPEPPPMPPEPEPPMPPEPDIPDIPEMPDLPEPFEGEQPAELMPSEPEIPEASEGDFSDMPPGTGDFDIPDSLLSGLTDELEAAPADDFGDTEDLLSGMEDQAGESADLLSGAEDPSESSEENSAESSVENPAGEFPEADFDDFSADSLDLGGELSAEAEIPEAAEPGEIPDFAEFAEIPENLEAGETPESPASAESLDSLEIPGADSPPELPEMGDFSIPDLDISEDLGGEMPMEDLGGEMPVEDLGGETPLEDLGGEMPLEDLGGEMPLEDLGGELSEEPSGDETGGMDFSIPEDGAFDMGGEAESGSLEAPAGDSFDAFNPAGDFSAADADINVDDETAPSGGDFGALEEEFSLPGIDDVFAGTSVGGKSGAFPGLTGSSGTGGASEEVEEIQLTDEELAQFQKTLAGYPLNLRIACEELIAEQAVAPDLMSNLVKLLIRGASAKETAALAGKILGRTISIPRGFEKSTGEALEAEQASFAYIFVHKFLPVLRLFLMVAIVAASLFYLVYQFIYTPLRAESIYKIGYERLFAGEYQRANDRFSQAFRIHRNKDWFYRYAEAFRDERQYLYAEEKYDELLRFYPRDKKGVLDYAAMETNYLRNYAKAESLLRRNLLDYAPDDREGLLALGDNSLAWGEIDASKYEDARFSYARLLEKYGWTDPVVERMMKYFIRTDNLKEVLPLQSYFMGSKRRKISADSLAELGGYLLDKRLEEARGVPNEYVEQIEGIRDILLRAVQTDSSLPEPHYHLSRYYHNLGNAHEERITLETAIRAFDGVPEGSIRRIMYRIDAQKRYADILINNREFFPAEEQLIKGIGIYEDALARRLFAPSPEFGRLYAGLGDLEYFTKAGDMETVLQYYRRSEQNGWAPPEMLYRMGSAHYHLGEWKDSLERFFTASSELPLNRRLLYALGNASYQRGDYFAAQGYYNRLLDILETERSRLPLLLPNESPDFVELAERLMIARNNLGATLEALTEQTGSSGYRSRALALYSESARAWDTLTRNPQTMIRSGAGDFSTPGINLPYLNSRNALYPQPGYEPQIFIQIDKDVFDPSPWEHLAPQGSRLAQ
jgi:tetratricopeptide (TPR) repeat protein